MKFNGLIISLKKTGQYIPEVTEYKKENSIEHLNKIDVYGQILFDIQNEIKSLLKKYENTSNKYSINEKNNDLKKIKSYILKASNQKESEEKEKIMDELIDLKYIIINN